MKLKDKVAIVTGAGRGIGREIALTFSNQGANLVIVDIDKNSLEGVYREVNELGRSILKVNADVSKSPDVRELVDKTLQNFKRVDILVNNAVYTKYDKFLEFQEDEWDRVIDVGLKGYFLCAQTVGREMVKNRSGKIINMASITGELAFQNGCAYCSSKGGL